MARLIESSLWVDFTRKKSPPALKASIQPWILDPEACLWEPVAFEVLSHATPQERKQIETQFATLPILTTPARLWRDVTRLGQTCGVETRALKQAVRRNLDRFPEDFMFELSEAEVEDLVSQNVIPGRGKLIGAFLPSPEAASISGRVSAVDGWMSI